MSNINLFSQFDETSGEDHGYKNGHHECKEEEEDLIVFGYSCKLFRDDFSAKAIDRGQSLIPWNGDENVMIDRCANKTNSSFHIVFISNIDITKKKKHENSVFKIFDVSFV